MILEEISIESIEEGERTRTDYGEDAKPANVDFETSTSSFADLVSDIKKQGLIQPLAVQKNANDKYLLLAGGRRLRAAFAAGMAKVPARVFEGELTDLEKLSIEYAENFFRKNLNWIEHCRLQKKFHNLHLGMKGPKIGPADTEGHSQRDTAKLLGRNVALVSRDIQLAEAIEAFPELQQCKTATEAKRSLSKINEAVVVHELSKRIQSEREKSGISTRQVELINRYILCDFFEGVSKIPDSSIDLVEIDPPYAIDLPKAKMGYTYGDSYNEVSKENYPNFMYKTFSECYRVMAEHSWLIVWFAPEPWFEDIFTWITDAGFHCRRMPAIWVKPSGQCKRPEIHLANSYEMFFYASKGNPSLAIQGQTNVFRYDPVPSQSKVHPTERPTALMEDILSVFTWEGSRVMVPFLGSGNTILSAENLGMSGFGFELSEEYKDSFTVKIATHVL